MTDQPHGSYTGADLERVIARDFGQASIPAVKTLLSRYGQKESHWEVLRVQMACVKLAKGDLKQLERWVAEACFDYRDVLSPAEYPTYGKAKTPGAQQKAIERDWQQLQAWLNRK